MGVKEPNSGSIKKGEVRNPLGRKAHDPEKAAVKRAMKNFTEGVFKEIIEDVLLVNPQQLGDSVAENPTVLKQWIAKAAEKGVNNGDLNPLMLLADRILGTPKQRMEVTEKKEELTLEQLEEERQKILARLNSESPDKPA